MYRSRTTQSSSQTATALALSSVAASAAAYAASSAHYASYTQQSASTLNRGRETLGSLDANILTTTLPFRPSSPTAKPTSGSMPSSSSAVPSTATVHLENKYAKSRTASVKGKGIAKRSSTTGEAVDVSNPAGRGSEHPTLPLPASSEALREADTEPVEPPLLSPTGIDSTLQAAFSAKHYQLLDNCRRWERYASKVKAKADALEAENGRLRALVAQQEQQIQSLVESSTNFSMLADVEQTDLFADHPGFVAMSSPKPRSRPASVVFSIGSAGPLAAAAPGLELHQSRRLLQFHAHSSSSSKKRDSQSFLADMGGASREDSSCCSKTLCDHEQFDHRGVDKGVSSSPARSSYCEKRQREEGEEVEEDEAADADVEMQLAAASGSGSGPRRLDGYFPLDKQTVSPVTAAVSALGIGRRSCAANDSGGEKERAPRLNGLKRQSPSASDSTSSLPTQARKRRSKTSIGLAAGAGAGAGAGTGTAGALGNGSPPTLRSRAGSTARRPPSRSGPRASGGAQSLGRAEGRRLRSGSVHGAIPQVKDDLFNAPSPSLAPTTQSSGLPGLATAPTAAPTSTPAYASADEIFDEEAYNQRVAHRRLYAKLKEELTSDELAKFEKYVHRYDALEIPLDGPRGLINRVKKLLLLTDPTLQHRPAQYKLRRSLAREFEAVVRMDV